MISFFDDRNHNLEDGDIVILDEILGMSELNGKERKIEVINKKLIKIGDTSK